METGFTLVFAGEHFEPDKFLGGSSVAHFPWVVLRKGEAGPRPNTKRVGSVLEYSDIREGRYPLNMVREALDLLHCHRADFVRLAQDPTIEFRTLNFFDAGGGCFDLESEDIELLHALKMSVSIIVCEDNGASRPNQTRCSEPGDGASVCIQRSVAPGH